MIKFAVILSILLVTCSGNKTTSNLQEIYGQKIILPEKGRWRIMTRDTVILRTDKPQIVAYYNSRGCTPCRLKELTQWKDIINNIDTINVDFVFVFATGNELRDLTFSLRQYRFNYPILCDTQKEFEAMNLLPDNEIFHYFLLDKSGKVCLVGSPINNPSMLRLYKQRITELNLENYK